MPSYMQCNWLQIFPVTFANSHFFLLFLAAIIEANYSRTLRDLFGCEYNGFKYVTSTLKGFENEENAIKEK